MGAEILSVVANSFKRGCVASFERSSFNVTFRTQVAFCVSLIFFMILGARLWYLQVVQRDYFRERAENNRLRTVFIPPPRGLILDRGGKVIAKNRPAFDIDFVPEDAPHPREVVLKLAEILKRAPSELQEQLGSQNKRRRFEPKLLLRDVDRDTVAQIMARRFELPGILVTVTPTRDYVEGELAPHVLGYLREITGDQLKSPDFSGYRSGDLVGQFGLESQWERFLQGTRGVQRVIVNANGAKIGEASSEPSLPGHDIQITLDTDVQHAAKKAMEGKSGAVIALDARTGEILALTSAPTFDPNIFTQQISTDEWRELTTGPKRRLNNRVVQGEYPPGSVFKIIMAVAALAEGVTNTDERVNCPGWYQLGSRKFHCHKKEGHGSVDLKEAMMMSCDVYFYTMGQRLGVDRIHDYAVRFGLGSKTGLKLVSEATGLIPSTEWKRRFFKKPEDQKWYPGETPSVAIGQGAVTVTPLQIARALAALVNGGKVLTPHLVKAIRSVDGNFKDDDFKPEVQSELGVDPKILKTVRDTLFGVVNDKRGTAIRARLDDAFGITVAGKTGTAQAASLQLSAGNEQLGDHAWFAAYAPTDNPEIVVVTLVENGGHGGVTSAPVVKQVMEAYFSKTRGISLVKKDDGKKEGEDVSD